MFNFLRSLFVRAPEVPAPKPEQLVQIGGRLLNVSEWSPELVEALKKEFFMPSCKDAYLMRVDLSGGCPEGHTTTERVGVFTRKGDFSKKIADDLNKIRLQIPCKECGKPAKITGRRTAWQGDLGTWDGAV